MEKISDWWNVSLALDHCTYLQELELRLPAYSGRLAHLNTLRRYLVDFLAQICEKYNLCLTTRHLTISLLDFFMDGNVLVNEHCQISELQLVGMAALLISAKFEEREVCIPRLSDLNKCVSAQGLTFSSNEFMDAEIMLLKFFNWSIGLPTAAHFIHYFFLKAISVTDRFLDNSVINFEMAETYLKKFLRYFMEISLQSYECRLYKPSVVCAACIAASRACLHLKEAWTSDLQQHTGYLFCDIQPVVQILISNYERDKICGRSNNSSSALQISTNNGNTHHSLLVDQTASL